MMNLTNTVNTANLSVILAEDVYTYSENSFSPL